MMRFNKGYNLKITLLLAVIFLLNSTLYGIELCNKSHLRAILIFGQGEKAVEEKIVKQKIEKILLIVPETPGKGLAVRIPLDVSYLFASLKERFGNKIDVKILDMATKEKDFNLESFIYAEKPDLVGIAIRNTRLLDNACKVAETVKRNLPDCIVVAGGVHTSADPMGTIKKPYFDIAVQGEGEIILNRLVETISSSGKISRIKGLWYRADDEKPIFTGLGEFPDMDELPFMPPQGLNINDYNLASSFFGGERAISLMTSRGCPYGCRYCSYKAVSTKKPRFKSSENVVKEIEYVIEKYGIYNFDFYDDTFTLLPQRVERLCDLIIEKKIPIKWRCQTRPDKVDRALLAKMKAAGCILVEFGFESGDQEILNVVNKNATVEQFKEAIRQAKEVGLKVRLFLMVGLPFQTMQSVKKTIRFLEETVPDMIDPEIYVPFPGSEFYEDFEKWGIHVVDASLSTYRYVEREEFPDPVIPVIETDWMTREQILQAKRQIIEAFRRIRPKSELSVRTEEGNPSSLHELRVLQDSL